MRSDGMVLLIRERSRGPMTTSLWRRALAPACLLCVAPLAPAADEAIVTDRPDFVESSLVVGKGRLQIETSLLLERDRQPQGRARSVSTPTLLRIGVSETLELRAETDGRIRARQPDAAGGATRRALGYADTALGLKWHALDAQGNRPSVGVLLHADLDSGSRAFRGDGVRPSLRVAAEWDLPRDWSLGVMPGIGQERDEDGRRYRYGSLGVVLGKELREGLRGFVELALPQIARASHGGTQASIDLGAAWLLSRDCQLDAMFSRGLNGRTPDTALTVGLSFRR